VIKEHTTPGKGKTVAVPGQPDVKALGFENDLYHIFEEQHDRIDRKKQGAGNTTQTWYVFHVRETVRRGS
jgi:hypothetical protein